MNGMIYCDSISDFNCLHFFFPEKKNGQVEGVCD